MPRLHFAIILLLSTVISVAARTTSIKGTISPSIPSAFAGRSLSLNCTLDANSADVVSARNISFEYTNSEIKQKAVTKVIGDRIARLTIQGVYLNMSNSRISCRVGNHTLQDVAIVVQQANFPEPPVCIVYNWESMTCSWEYEETDNSTTVSLAYSRLLSCTPKFACPHLIQAPGQGNCTWRALDDRDTFFFINHCVCFVVKNVYNATATSRSNWIYVDNLVKPNSVAIESSKTGINYIALNFTLPYSNKDFMFRVAFESRFSSTLIKETKKASIRLSNLIPNTKYNLRIDCIPRVGHNKTGFWSDPLTAEYTTKPDVPGDTPSVTPGGFQVIERNNSHRKVKLFFKPVDDILIHGDVEGYRVRYSVTNFSQEFESSIQPANVILTMEMEEMYAVSMEIRNVIGYNESLIPKTFVVGRQSELPHLPENFIVQTDDNSTYVLNWTVVDGISSYTLYWCSSNHRLFDCKNTLDWKVLPPNQTSQVLQVAGLPDLVLRFALSVEKVAPSGEVVSSGMWIANCSYSITGELKPPEHARLVRRVGHTATIEWSHPKCDEKIAYNSHYRIAYCQVKNCNDTVKTVTVESFRGSVTIDGLDKDVEYEFRIWGASAYRESSAAPVANSLVAEPLAEGPQSVPVEIIVVLLIVIVASCAVPMVVKCICWWKKKWHIEVKPPAKFVGDTPSPSSETNGYSTFLRSDLSSNGHVQTTICESGRDRMSHGFFNSAAFQLDENEGLLSRHGSEYKSSTSSSEMSSLPCTQSNSAGSKSSSSEHRRDSGISASISGYNVVIERPCETPGSPVDFLAGFPSDEDLVATTKIC